MTVGLRERKKTETRRAISTAALQLAIERGPDRVTVDDIALVADVSPRTVFNYFATKEEAILGIDPERGRELAVLVRDRPAAEAPLEALGAVLVEVLTSADDAGELWRARARLVSDHPQLRAAQVSAQEALDRELTQAIASRTGLDADRSAYPRLVVTVALHATRTALERAGAAGRARLRREMLGLFDMLASGLRPPGAEAQP